MSDWYVDARQTTFSGEGATIVGRAVLAAIDGGALPGVDIADVDAVGGMTMGADPIAVATAMAAADAGHPIMAFSIRKTTKDHGTGGRLVGPVGQGSRVVAIDDTVSTGGALIESIEVAAEHGLIVLGAVALVDRSDGAVATLLGKRSIPYLPLVTPDLLGVA
jgi:orotate phosphoribosyltransferase